MQKACMKIRVHIRVWGKVQRVGFRYAVREMARNAGLSGIVKNEKGESVFIEAEGERAAVGELVRFSAIGPKHANVERMDIRFYRTEDKFQNFDIL